MKNNLSKSKQFFLICMSDLLHAKRTMVTEEIDWEELLKIARSQSLVAAIYYQCDRFIPKSIKKNYLRSYLAHIFISFMRKDEFKKLIACFKDANVNVICMKGSVFRDLYPIPALRSMGDIDCIIHESDRNAVDKIMCKELGYQKFVDNHAVWTYWKENLYFEIHTHMFYEHLANDVNYVEYFDHIWENCHNAEVFEVSSDNLYIPDVDFHFIYLITHTAKHVTNKGSGFRPYLDMVLFVKRYKDQMDWGRIEKELKKLQLLQFAKTCFGLCKEWFGVDMPLKPGELDEEFVYQATEKAFNDGVFGLENKENTAANSAKELKRSHMPKAVASVMLTWKKLFPPYRDMQLVPWYSFVDGKPWLMPYAWVYRWFYVLKHKKDEGFDLLAEPFTKEDIIIEREKWLQKWGL